MVYSGTYLYSTNLATFNLLLTIYLYPKIYVSATFDCIILYKRIRLSEITDEMRLYQLNAKERYAYEYTDLFTDSSISELLLKHNIYDTRSNSAFTVRTYCFISRAKLHNTNVRTVQPESFEAPQKIMSVLPEITLVLSLHACIRV